MGRLPLDAGCDQAPIVFIVIVFVTATHIYMPIGRDGRQYCEVAALAFTLVGDGVVDDLLGWNPERVGEPVDLLLQTRAVFLEEP
jgi:hypothetical protein